MARKKKLNPLGKPPKFRCPEDVQELIDKYFEECEGVLLTDPETGVPILDKWKHEIIIGKKSPTYTGLALALGFSTRKGLMKYEAKPEYHEIILRAKTRVEMYAEERLYDKEGMNGARFVLQNNFGWNETPEEEGQKGPAVQIICDIPRVEAKSTETAVFNPLMTGIDNTEDGGADHADDNRE